MNPTIPARVHARSRADQRLQSMTLGAAVLGIAATGVFGYAAALTYAGTTTTANAADQPAVVGNQNAGGGATGVSGSTGQANDGGTVNPFFGQVIPPTTSRHAHASSGGS